MKEDQKNIVCMRAKEIKKYDVSENKSIKEAEKQSIKGCLTLMAMLSMSPYSSF